MAIKAPEGVASRERRRTGVGCARVVAGSCEFDQRRYARYSVFVLPRWLFIALLVGGGVLAFLTIALGLTRDTLKGIEMLLGLGLLVFLGGARVARYLREHASRRLSMPADEEVHTNS